MRVATRDVPFPDTISPATEEQPQQENPSVGLWLCNWEVIKELPGWPALGHEDTRHRTLPRTSTRHRAGRGCRVGTGAFSAGATSWEKRRCPWGLPRKGRGWRCDHCPARLGPKAGPTPCSSWGRRDPGGPHSQSGSCQTATSPAECWVWRRTSRGVWGAGGGRPEEVGPEERTPSEGSDPRPGTAGSRGGPRWSLASRPLRPPRPRSRRSEPGPGCGSGAASSWRSPWQKPRCPRPVRSRRRHCGAGSARTSRRGCAWGPPSSSSRNC